MWLVVWKEGKLSGSLCLCQTQEEAKQVIERVSITAERNIKWGVEYVPIWTVTPKQSED